MFRACFVITEACNLSCEYCYMNNRKVFMSRDVFDFHYKETLPYFMKHYDHDEYELDIFGGEPLEHWFMVSHIIHHTKGDPKLKSLNLITNGLLLNDQRVEILKKHNIKCSLSFDGLWAQHLKTYVSLKPRLQKLFDSCSVCVTPRHMNMAENFKFLIEEFNFIPRFKIVRDNIWTKDDVEKFKFELDKLEEVYFDYLKKGKSIFPSIFEKRLLMLLESSAHQMSKMRCFVGHCGAAFSHDGKVYPCARFLTDDYYPIYDNGVLEENLSIIDDTANKFEGCSGCELEDHCQHICLHQEMMNKGIVSNVCELYKAVEGKVLDINDKLRGNDEWKKYISKQIRRTSDG